LPRSARVVGPALVLVLLAGLLVLLFGPARGVPRDIHAQRGLISQQRDLIKGQLDTVRGQLDVADEQLGLTRQQLTESQRTREATEQALQTAQATPTTAQQTLAVTLTSRPTPPRRWSCRVSRSR
jgi:hypothetical protein